LPVTADLIAAAAALAGYVGFEELENPRTIGLR
jgi:hypothetical protein